LHHRSADAFAFTRPATAYHVVYSVDRGAKHATEQLWVNRPFVSEQITQTTHIVSRLGRQLLATDGAPAVLEVAPQPPQFDQRVDAIAPGHLLQRRGVRSVAGMRCQVIRTRTVLAADFAGPPTPGDYVDSCVSANGVVLEQTSVRSGEVVSKQVATKVAFGPHHKFATAGVHVPRAQGGGRIITLDPSSRPPGPEFFELAAAPKGFTHLGRFAVVAPAPANAPVVTSVDDVFVRGADMIVVEQGETLSGIAMAPAEGSKVDLGRLGTGRLVVSPVASSVSALTKARGSFVRVTGTVAPSRLVAVARALRSRPGGSLVTIPDLTSDGAA
jgi:hypothetical protein